MISNNELKKLKNLTKLEFTNDESTILLQNLHNITKMISKLEEVNCTGVEPLTSVCNSYQRLREDSSKSLNISEDIFKNIPQQVAKISKQVKCFVVPKVIE